MEIIEYKEDAKFNRLQVPLPLMYRFCIHSMPKSVFLASVFLHNLLNSHKQYGSEHYTNFVIKSSHLLKEIHIGRGYPSKEIKDFFQVESEWGCESNSKVNIRIEKFMGFVTSIGKKNKRTKSEDFKRHYNFMGNPNQHIKLGSDFFEYVSANKLNKLKLKLFLLILRKKLTPTTMRNPVGYDYLKEFTRTIDVKRIVEHTEDLEKMGIIKITNRDNFDCKVRYLDGELTKETVIQHEVTGLI